ncbi:MAG TPA: hypothetical protein VHD87_14855 [Acidimicrobiales bacterium]|nr:hypothetical protein [Acidimicrobiales bacterium]
MGAEPLKNDEPASRPRRQPHEPRGHPSPRAAELLEPIRDGRLRDEMNEAVGFDPDLTV